MSQLSQSLEKRIQELKASIEAQKTELAAYERVLHMETTKPSSSDANEATIAVPGSTATKKRASKKAAKKASKRAVKSVSAPAAEAPAVSPDASSVPFTGNKTGLVAEIVKSYGSTGATPKDVDAVFSARNVERSKNLIYNTLSYLVAQKKLQRRDGKYFAGSGSAAPAKKSAAAATKKTRTKRRLSPEGLKRIKEALKKRWAAKRAAEAAATKKK